MVVELRLTLRFTQHELQNTKDLVHKIEAENDAQDTEMTAVKTRLAASETEVMNLRKEAAAQTADLRSVAERLAATETDTAAQHTDLTTMKTEVMNMIKEQAAHEAELVVLKARMDTGEAQVETEVAKLKMEHAAQEAELTAVKNRLAATETEVVNLEKEITEKPKVAFSVGLTNSGIIQAGTTELNLIFTKIFTNVGQAYNDMTGYFTAPVRGVYYFRFTVHDNTAYWLEIRMYKNVEQVMYLWENNSGVRSYLSGGVTLQLEAGDVVNLRVPVGYKLYDDSHNHCIFSGFLLFPL
ncbi:heavy metal-binding protein HIP-like [Clupea harengus]|uniref:Heavy metal-binding protein HIP-like n=1 Tax=Clupea harengus TaxID=7950 RepID=A0A6P8FCI8_CLUHA|nr:heavy metal-binding protein HIP-like [Clupea harengus]